MKACLAIKDINTLCLFQTWPVVGARWRAASWVTMRTRGARQPWGEWTSQRWLASLSTTWRPWRKPGMKNAETLNVKPPRPTVTIWMVEVFSPPKTSFFLHSHMFLSCWLLSWIYWDPNRPFQNVTLLFTFSNIGYIKHLGLTANCSNIIQERFYLNNFLSMQDPCEWPHCHYYPQSFCCSFYKELGSGFLKYVHSSTFQHLISVGQMCVNDETANVVLSYMMHI